MTAIDLLWIFAACSTCFICGWQLSALVAGRSELRRERRLLAQVRNPRDPEETRLTQ